MNLQPIEKQHLEPSGTLAVHSIFFTIQGEGPYTGRPAVFVRLAGCNLQCPSCDTEYTSRRAQMSVLEIIRAIGNTHGSCKIKPIVVISGGEPFRQNIAPLVRNLVSSQQYTVQIETNGSLYIENMPWDSITVVCSPKSGKLSPLLVPHIDAFKYVMSYDSVDPDDGLPILALDHTAKPRVARPPVGNTKPVYIQPMDAGILTGATERNLKACVQSSMKYGYTLQLQVHKIIGVE